MTETEYLNLKRQIIAYAERRHNEIEAEKSKQLESLETVWGLFSTLGNVENVQATATSQSSFPLAEAIRRVLPEFTGAFNINDIMQRIEAHGFDVKKPMNPTSVSGALRKLQDAGTLEVVEAGKGKRPSSYKVIKETARFSSEGELLSDEQKGQALVGASA